MCNEHRLKRAVKEIADAFSQLRLPLEFPEGIPNLEPRDRIRIGDSQPVVRPALLKVGAEQAPEAHNAVEMVTRRWSWPGPRGAPVFNFRSEGRRFAQATRCAIPTDGFYEFTTPEDPEAKRKDRWLFTMPAEPLFFIAGHMRDDAWAMLTTEPGPDLAPYHSRQIVVMSPAQAGAWLTGAGEAEILRPAPAGTLVAERA